MRAREEGFMQLGVVFPHTEMGTDPGGVRTFTEATERAGYDYLLSFDHVLGADPDRPGGWDRPYTHKTYWHEPMVLFGYLAAITRRLELVTGILILPQRQTALVAKQAAEIDRLSGGRLRLGVGIGWNWVEYEGLGEDFHNRGRRMEEQIAVLRGLFNNQSFTLDGKYHHVIKAGINPQPSRSIPIWMGGQSDSVVERAGRLADGWMPLFPNPEDIAAPLAKMREAARKAGRDPRTLGIDARVSLGNDPRDAVAQALRWRDAGATHLGVSSMGFGRRLPEEHIDAIERFKRAYDEAVRA